VEDLVPELVAEQVGLDQLQELAGSVPRLSKGQATIVGVGALDYPAEFRGSSPRTLARKTQRTGS
jgi:hypothetical protein